MSAPMMKFHPFLGYELYGVEQAFSAEYYRAQYPDALWIFNPWTGQRRDPLAVEVDPKGLFMKPTPEEAPHDQPPH